MLKPWIQVHVPFFSSHFFTGMYIFYMNTCQAPHLKLSSESFTMATTALFFASEQTHCALVVRNSEGVTVALQLHSVFWMSTEVVTVLFTCSMADAMWNCCLLGACSVDTIQPGTSLQCRFIQSHRWRVHVCLAVACHLHFWQNDWDLLHATAVTWGEMDTEIRVSTESWPWRRKFSCHSCWVLNLRPFDHRPPPLICIYLYSIISYAYKKSKHSELLFVTNRHVRDVTWKPGDHASLHWLETDSAK